MEEPEGDGGCLQLCLIMFFVGILCWLFDKRPCTPPSTAPATTASVEGKP